MPVRSATFVADPVGAQVAFLEDVQPQAVVLRSLARSRMDRADVAVKDDVGHLSVGDDPGEVGGPLGAAAGMAQQVRRIRPEELVPRVERASPDFRTGPPQQLAQPVEEWSMRPLQQQKDPLVRTRHVCQRGSLPIL